MADYVIKKQILSHFSKFAKNKTEKNLTISTLRGKGVMSDLELDENVLTEFLELPSWIKITNATCNKIVFDISLKIPTSCPLKLTLDEINVEIVTCEELRSVSPESISKLVEDGSYGLKHRIIDGASVSINTINVRFLSRNYVASIMVSNVSVVSDVSNNAKWLLKGPNGQLLIRKLLTWQNLKFEVKPPPGSQLHPFRLITDERGTLNITLKKKSDDCSLIGSRIIFHMKEFGWPLTDDQVKTLVDFIKPITQLVEKSMEKDHQETAGRKLKNLYEDEQIKSQSQQAKGDAVYHRFDFIETSFHLLFDSLEFYLYDESAACRSSHPELRKGSSLIIHLGGLQIDYYPYHLSSKSRGHWLSYHNNNILTKWHCADHQAFYRDQFPSHEGDNAHPPDNNQFSNTHRRCSQLQSMLMNLCFVVRLNNMKIHKVNQKDVFLSVSESSKSNHKHDKTVVHLEFLSYYTPGNFSKIIPTPKLYGFIRCMNVNVDPLTILWLNSYFLHLHGTIQSFSQKGNAISANVQADIQEVNIIFEYLAQFINQKDRPTKMHIKCCGVHIHNDIHSSGKQEDFDKCMRYVTENEVFSLNVFPGKEGDYSVLPPELMNSTVKSGNGLKSGDYNGNPCRNQVWCIFIDMLLGNFLGLKISPKPVPFFDTTKLNIWLFEPSSITLGDVNKGRNSTAHLNVLISISNLFKFQTNHYQYLFVMRLLETFNELTTVLANDKARFGEVTSGMCVCLLLSRVTASFLMPPQLNEKSSSKGDITPESLCSPDMPIKRESESLSDISSYCPKDPPPTMFSSYHEEAFQSVDFEILTPDVSIPSTHDPTDHLTSRRTSSSLSSRSTSWIDNISNSLSNLKDRTLDLSSLSIKESVTLELHDSSAGARFFVEPKEAVAEEVIECYTPSKSCADYSRLDEMNIDGASDVTDDVELASDALEEFNPKDLYFYGRNDPVSVVTFHLGSVDIVQQSFDMTSTSKMYLQKMAIEEITSIPFDEFQEKYLNKDTNVNTLHHIDTKGSFKCRMDQSPSSISKLREFLPDKSNTHSNEGFERYRRLSALFSSCLETHISNFSFKVSLSSVMGLINLVEDEVIHRPYPIKINLKDLSIHLVDDRQASSITSPDVTSFGLNISSLILLRNDEGNYSVCSTSEPSVNEASEVSRLKRENELLRARINQLEEQMNARR